VVVMKDGQEAARVVRPSGPEELRKALAAACGQAGAA
jgi:hypothetical protein